jgi:hypothetical protein
MQAARGATTLMISKEALGLKNGRPVQMVLDNTPSVDVGATTADIKMASNTPDQCALACHDLSNANSCYDLAKILGVTMRVDVLRIARPLFRGQPEAGHLGRNERAAQEGDRTGASDRVGAQHGYPILNRASRLLRK